MYKLTTFTINTHECLWQKAQKKYPDALECNIVDHSDGCGAKLELTVVSNTFEGMPLIKRHREVQNHLKEKGLFEEIHALQIKAWTGEQWEKKKGGNWWLDWWSSYKFKSFDMRKQVIVLERICMGQKSSNRTEVYL